MAVSGIKIKTDSLSKSFETKKGTLEVLKNISFDVYENEFLVILGPGQCGKTVLLNMLSNIEQPDMGSVSINGSNTIGFVFQRYALFNWKTVIKNVEAPLRYQGVEKQKREEVARKYLELVGLKDFENAYPM